MIFDSAPIVFLCASLTVVCLNCQSVCLNLSVCSSARLIIYFSYLFLCLPVCLLSLTLALHDDFIKWKHFPRYWPVVSGIHRSPVNSSHKSQWRGALMFSLICVRINAWVNNCDANDRRCHRAHYDVTVWSRHLPPSSAASAHNVRLLRWVSEPCVTRWPAVRQWQSPEQLRQPRSTYYCTHITVEKYVNYGSRAG